MLGSYENMREIKIRNVTAVDRSVVPAMKVILRHRGSVICSKGKKLSDNEPLH